MMKRLFFAMGSLGLLSLLSLGGCATSGPSAPVASIDRAHHSNNSLDWDGVYTGRVPSASGMGIETKITLRSDHTYTLSERYVGKNRAPFVSSGKFTWHENGGVIRLEEKADGRYYQVGENVLRQLDLHGKPISGALAEHYLLKKAL